MALARRRGDSPHLHGRGRVLTSTPGPADVSVSGKVLDASAVAGWLRGSISMQAWVAAARRHGMTLLIPDLAVSEAFALYPDRPEVLVDLVEHPQVLLDGLTASERDAVAATLDATTAFDVVSAWVVLRARDRGRPALSSDPVRLRRLDPSLPIDPA